MGMQELVFSRRGQRRPFKQFQPSFRMTSRGEDLITAVPGVTVFDTEFWVQNAGNSDKATVIDAMFHVAIQG
jgi:hypothetical protein